MRRRIAGLLLAGSALAAALAACGDDSPTGGGGSTATGVDGGAGAGGETSQIQLRVEPAELSIEAILGELTPTVELKAFATIDGGAETDVTAEADWELGNTIVGIIDAGELFPAGIAGDTTIRASYEAETATVPLHIKLVGDVVMPGEDPTLPDQFEAATTDPTPANAPVLEYPEDGVVLPGNLPPVEAQWTLAADNVAYRVRITSGDLIDASFYTSARELLFTSEIWYALRHSAPDREISIRVDGLSASAQLREGAPRTLTISADQIDDSAIYVWQSSTGSFRVLDIVAGTDVPLPSDSPALGPGQPCSGCHRISRDGKRFAYSFNGANFQIGTLAFNQSSGLFESKVNPAPGVRGTYATFNPNEEDNVPAMILSVPEDVPQNTAGKTSLTLVDPDTNGALDSNLAESLAGLAPLSSTLMPDWSPDGSFVVFVAYNSDANYVRELGDDVVNASIVELSVFYSQTLGKFQFSDAKVLVSPPTSGSPDTDENNFLPTVSPDGTAVAFTRSSGWWSIKTQQSLLNLSGRIALVRRADNTVLELARGSNEAGAQLSSTWPQWAPTVGNKYMWLAYASERPYGHRLTPASPENAQCGFVQGQNQCKQLWVMAIDRAMLESGTEDPSRAAFWIPGQTLSAQYVSPQWTKAILPPPQ